MLVYAEEKKNFMLHVRDNRISEMVADCMKRKLGRRVGLPEQRSWQVSLQHMRNILDDTAIPDNSGIAIEYNVPQTGKRIDFIISGYDENQTGNIIIVELKQWDEAKLTKMDAIVRVARFGNVLHPSYQAWSYKTVMEDYNTTIEQEQIGLYPCAYLHNYKEDENEPIIKNEFYENYLREAPVFLMDDNEKLRSFIKSFIKHGDKKEVLYKLHRLIREKNAQENSASGSRIVAGYCWPWASKKNPKATDINIGDYHVKWNKTSDGSLWAISEDSIDEIGCIHTCQGLEFDYVGVIIGEDLIVKNDMIVTQPEARDKVDANKTLRGYKTMIKDTDSSVVEKAKIMADEIIRNTYKVLMTRGQKGCYVYCCNRELAEYLKRRICNSYYNCNEESLEYLMVAEDTDKEYGK